MNTKYLNESLPWYVNGSLSSEEQAEIENNLTDNSGLANEKDILVRLRQYIKHSAFQSPGEIGLQRLKRDIKKETSRKPLSKWQSYSVAASLVLVVQLGIILSFTQENDIFIPLSGTANYSKNVVQMQFKNSATLNQINNLLLSIDATIISGPSKKGIYRIQLTTFNDKVIDDLRQRKDIVDFLAKEQ